MLDLVLLILLYLLCISIIHIIFKKNNNKLNGDEVNNVENSLENDVENDMGMYEYVNVETNNLEKIIEKNLEDSNEISGDLIVNLADIEKDQGNDELMNYLNMENKNKLEERSHINNKVDNGEFLDQYFKENEDIEYLKHKQKDDFLNKNVNQESKIFGDVYAFDDFNSHYGTL